MKFSINRKNRDRRGGHKMSELTISNKSFWWGTPLSKKEREFIKKTSKRELRRQHKKATQRAIAEFHQEMEEVARMYDLMWSHYDNDYTYSDYEDYLEEIDHGMGYDDDFDYVYYPENYDGYDNSCYYDGYGDPQEAYGRNRIITLKDLGKTIGELLDEYNIRFN